MLKYIVNRMCSTVFVVFCTRLGRIKEEESDSLWGYLKWNVRRLCTYYMYMCGISSLLLPVLWPYHMFVRIVFACIMYLQTYIWKINTMQCSLNLYGRLLQRVNIQYIVGVGRAMSFLLSTTFLAYCDAMAI